MNADWEIEIGGDAPVIEALWPGFIDLRTHPGRISEISEVAAHPPLAGFLQHLNSADSPLWTSKCDVWVPEPGALAIYIDMLPRNGIVFADWSHAEAFCRDLVRRLALLASDSCGVDLVIRQAIAGDVTGFGITAYLSASGADDSDAARLLADAMVSFVDALPRSPHLATPLPGQ